MGYEVSDIKLYKEEQYNVAPSSPKVLLIKNTSSDLKEEQNSEIIDLLGNGHQPNRSVYGLKKFSGSLGFVLGGGYLPILLEGVVGQAEVADASTQSWEADTAYMAGDIVNHSNTMHSLVAYKVNVGGVSDSVEPDLSTLKDGDTVVDAGITWIVRDKLYSRIGTLDACLPSFGIERKDTANCSQMTDHYEFFSGLIMSSLELKKEGEEIKFDISESVTGGGADNSFSNEYYNPLVSGKEVAESFYSAEDLELEVFNGTSYEPLTGADTISLNIQRENNIVYGATETRPEYGKITIDGSMKGIMTRELYETSYLKQVKKIRFVFSKVNGDKSIITFNNVEFGASTQNIELGKDIMLDVKLTGFGTKNSSAVDYECITSVNL